MSFPRFTALHTAMQLHRCQQYRKTLTAGVLCSALIGTTLATPALAQDHAELEQSIQWQLPPQSLALSLTDLADRANLVFLLEEGALEQIQVPALRGKMSVQQALDTLLQDSGYSYSLGSGNRLMLHRTRQQETTILKPESIVVVGNWLDDADAEVRHSFPGARHKLTREANGQQWCGYSDRSLP